jgi:hypothetical protein
MARAENVQTISAQAGEVLAIFRFVHLMADGKFDYVDTDDLRADAVTAEAAAADLAIIAVAPCGQPAIMLVEASAAISVGDLIGADGGTGKAKTAAAAGAGLYSAGVAMTAAANDGDIIEVLLHLSANQA